MCPIKPEIKLFTTSCSASMWFSVGYNIHKISFHTNKQVKYFAHTQTSPLVSHERSLVISDFNIFILLFSV